MNRSVHRLPTPARLTTRSAGGAVIALLLALVVTSPAAAAQPTRTVHDLSSFTIPAGSGCAFDVEGQPSWGFVAKTDFGDGRVQYSVRAHGAYVNLETGARFATADTSLVVDQFDPATGIDVVYLSGQNSYSFVPGDVGPFGVVTTSDGAFYHIDGSVSFTFDTNTGHTTQFAYSGSVTDICAALS
ncbi:MAG TPA: hypothetical protein VFC71_02115 [Candidatus Polarisedimenticolia bacterium]|nr:hypothetical protein [Candidatus Polarisedimenticolia bacterium]